MQKGPRVGMVIPVEDDNFRVLRFSLDGAADVIARADTARQNRGGGDAGSTGDTGRPGKRLKE